MVSKSIIKRLVILAETLIDGKNTYGGKGPFGLPPDHKAAVFVPKGGSSCANCRFVSEDQKECLNKYYITWNGGDSKLPGPADEICSDWYEQKK